MIVFLFSFFVLPLAVTNSLPFEGYGILLVDLYEQPLSLPGTDQETKLDVSFNELEEQTGVSNEIAINVGEESLAEMIDLLSIISGGYKKSMIGIDMQLYKVDNGFRQDLVSMNMIVDPSDEEPEEQYSEVEDWAEKSDSEGNVEEFFVDLHHTYSPYDRLVNSYYGANSANFLPMNLYRSFLAQSQQQPNPLPYDSEKLVADYWNTLLKQENLEAPSYMNYPSEYALNAYNKAANFPTLEDALRMYDMEVKNYLRSSEELYDTDEHPSDNAELENLLSTEHDVEEHLGIFSSFGNFFKRTWSALID